MSQPVKVQCQMTRLYLGPGAQKAEGVWECPHCGRGETYVQADVVDTVLCQLIHGAIDRARMLFDVEPDDRETRIWLGDGPEAVLEEDQNAFHIYLARDSNWLQHCYSGSHEAFHRACSPSHGSHWVDEMLAVHFSLLYLRELGLEAHAELNESGLERQAAICPREAILNPEGHRYPEGAYGAFFSLGQDLIEAVGPDGLVDLNRFRDPDGRPEPDRWVASLDEETRPKVEQGMAA